MTIVFKLFNKEIISMDSKFKWTEKKIRDPQPSWKDFTDKRIAIPQQHLNQVIEHLERKHFCILIGDKDTGKTWLSYALGYNLVDQDKRVRYATIDDNFKEEDAWDEIKDQELRGKDKPEIYLIMEDCHTNPQESEEFFQKALDEGEDNLRFLFTMRKTGKFLLEDVKTEDIFYNEGIKRDCIVTLLPGELIEEHVKNIIKKFIEIKEIKYVISGKELEDVAKKWGNDLYWVWLRLNSWSYSEGQKLSTVTDDQICESIWSDRGEIKLSLPERRKILFPLSVLCQFEPLRVYNLANFLEDNQKMLSELRGEGIINLSNWRGYDFVYIPENFSNLILLTTLSEVPRSRAAGHLIL